MKEYIIQFSSNGIRWCKINDCMLHPYKTIEDAKEEMKERKADHPQNEYRILERMVTDWEVVSDE